MKKSILFGALAFFAVSAMSIQDVNAQNEVKVNTKKAETVSEKQEKPAVSTVAQPVKKDDCCADKKLSTDKKESKDCCADKKVAADKKKTDDCCADKKVNETEKKAKDDAKVVKKEGKKVRHSAVKPKTQKAKKARSTTSEK